MPALKEKRRAVFIDRDGVINRTHFRDGKPRAPSTLEDFEYLPGVEEAIRTLREAGFLTIVVTNQPDVARGWQSRDVVEAMNRKVLDELQVDAVEVCYHDNIDDCLCRKPRPGMLTRSAESWEIDLGRSFMVGDRMSDIAAGSAAGCVSILVEPSDADRDAPEPAARVSSLLEAARWILARTR